MKKLVGIEICDICEREEDPDEEIQLTTCACGARICNFCVKSTNVGTDLLRTYVHSCKSCAERYAVTFQQEIQKLHREFVPKWQNEHVDRMTKPIIEKYGLGGQKHPR